MLQPQATVVAVFYGSTHQRPTHISAVTGKQEMMKKIF